MKRINLFFSVDWTEKNCVIKIFDGTLLLCKNTRSKWPEFKNMPKNVPEAEERRRISILILQKMMETICFLADVRQCNISFSLISKPANNIIHSGD